MTVRTRAVIGAGALLLMLSLLKAACSSNPPLPTVPQVDLQRFMGDWFVIAHVPASGEKNAYNAVESYRLEAEGEIATTYTFRDGGFDGEIEVMEPTGYVRNEETNATWGMQFFWPFRFEYLITWLDDDYSATIVARSARDYAWIMAREPEIPDDRYRMLVDELAEQGYDTSKLRRVPQRWPDPGHPITWPPEGR